MNTTKRAFATAALLVGLAVAGGAFAQPNPPAGATDPSGAATGREMLNGKGMMPGMMMGGEMQRKMMRMMDNCNRMMESMTPSKDGTPDKKG
jgi:hypothetical protein